MERRTYPQYCRLKMNNAPLKPLGVKELFGLKEFTASLLRKELPNFLPDSCKKDGPIFESWVEELASSISDFIGDARDPYGYDKGWENFERLHKTRKKIGNLFKAKEGFRLMQWLGSVEFTASILERASELRKS